MKVGVHSGMTALLLVLLFSSSFPVMAATNSQASMKINVGFQNYYDPRSWVPVHVTVSTTSRHPLHGEIVYVVSSRDRPFEGQYTWKLPVSTVGTGGVQSSSITIGLPGLFLKGVGELLWENNGQIVMKSHLPGIAISGSEIAGIISLRPESVQFLAGVSSDNGSTELVTAYIPPTSLPSSMPLLESLSYLYIDGSSAALLSPVQIQGILNWVRAGGILLLGGIEPNAGQVDGFLGQSPVVPSVVLDQPPTLLAKYAGSTGILTNESLLFGHVTSGAKVLVGSQNSALVAAKTMGRGKIVYVGFDASAPDYLSWSGYAQFWDTLLHSLRAQVLQSSPDLFGTNGVWGLYAASEQFPQMYSPPLWIWETVFGLYVFIVGPVLYFILRRHRRNEMAWLYLPVISLFVAGGIYVLGVMQRPNGILTQSVGMVDLLDHSLTQIAGVEAFMSPQTRSYSIHTTADTWSVPMSEQATGIGTSQTKNEFSGQSGKISFNKVNAWGGKFVLSLNLYKRFGYVNGTLYREGHSLAGYVTNQTRFNFTDAAFVVNHQVIAIGPMKKGQSVNISAVLQSVSSRSNVMAGLGTVLASANHGVGKSLFDNSGTFLRQNIPDGQAMLVAWSHDEPALLRPDGVTLPATPQWLIRELIPITPIKE